MERRAHLMEHASEETELIAETDLLLRWSSALIRAFSAI
jgi:hypothetical protein